MLTLIAEATLRSSVLVGSVWLLLRLCRIRDVHIEKLIWTMVAAASLAMPALILAVATVAIPISFLPTPIAGTFDTLAAAQAATRPLGAAALVLYGLGVAVLVTRFAIGLLAGVRMCREAQMVPGHGARSLDVRISAAIQSPASFGSIVLLPPDSAAWDPLTMQAVLAHEREHIRNHDCRRLWLAALCRAVFWFNPVMHWLHHRVATLVELTSDEAAIAAIADRGDRGAYVRILLQVAAGGKPFQATVAMATASTLARRLRLLLASDRPSAKLPASRKMLLGAAVLSLLAVVSACASRPLVLTAADLSALTVSNGPPASSLGEFYPEMLRRQHVQGKALVRITVDAKGHVIHADIVTENPAGVGLGAAAMRLARAYQFDNSLHRTVITTLPVKFAFTAPPKQRLRSE